MPSSFRVAFRLLVMCNLFVLGSNLTSAQEGAPALAPLCTPKVTDNRVVASPKQRYDAGQKAEPPLTDTSNGFAWPDTPMGIIKTDSGYEFFASDGGGHNRQMWHGHWVGNNKYGSFVTTTTNVSVARALASSVLEAAFGSKHPHAVPFEKFYEGSWHLQPGIGGASTDLNPKSAYSGYLDIHYNRVLQRYVMIISNDTTFAYAESIDALHWTVPLSLGDFGPIAAYPTAVGFGDDPHILGESYYVYFTHLPSDGTGWQNGALRRLTLSCQ